MKIRDLFLSIAIVLIFPILFLTALENKELTMVEPNEVIEQSADDVFVKVLKGSDVEEMPLETYIASVLLAEMPSQFQEEALKAQAVAIRTYTLRKILNSGKHETADVCVDSTCCQAYCNLDGSESALRMQVAVDSTKGEVIMYENELIEATYFSCSGGRTESALEVWGADMPYLQAQVSPGEEFALHYEDMTILSYDTFAEKLGLDNWPTLKDITYTQGGGVKTISIGGVTFTGKQLRELLQLRSTAFTIKELDEGVVITTKGFGHRVGMSQYGAEAMALSGHSYQDILLYYYTDTQLKKLSAEELMLMFDKNAKL